MAVDTYGVSGTQGRRIMPWLNRFLWPALVLGFGLVEIVLAIAVAIAGLWPQPGAPQDDFFQYTGARFFAIAAFFSGSVLAAIGFILLRQRHVNPCDGPEDRLESRDDGQSRNR